MAHLDGPIQEIRCPKCPPNPNPDPLPPGFDPGPDFPLAPEDGAQGPQGPAGTPGSPGGFQGAQGPQGNAGVQGVPGDKGVQGYDGFQGIPGNAGPQGAFGGPGPQGFQGVGFQGPAGSPGPQGVVGPTGTGSQGAQGPAGVQGTQGPEGSQGATGPQGPIGTGTQGTTGAGTQGATGGQGPCCQGPQGASGSQGPAGMDGSTGPEGPQGAAGDGTQGSTGSTGDTTNDFSFNGGFNFSTTFDATGTQVTSTIPDTKIFDCWKVAIENDGIDVHQSSNASVGGWASENRATFMKFGSAGKFMLYQILDFNTTRAFSNKQVIFTGYFSGSPAPVDMTMGFIQWNGTPNTVDTIIVSDWSTSPPTLSTNFSYYNSFDFTNSNTGLFNWGIDTGTLPNNLNNLIIFVCSKNQFSSGDHMDMGQFRLAIGTNFESYKPLPPTIDLERVESFVEKTYDMNTFPGDNSGDYNGSYSITQVGASDVYPIRYRYRKVKTPTITLYSPVTGAAGFWYDVDGAVDVIVSATDIGQTGFNLSVSGGTAGHKLKGHIVIDGSL